MTRDADAECFNCGAPANDTFGNGYLCAECQPDGDASAGDEEPCLNQQTPSNGSGALVNEEPTPGDGFNPTFTTPESGVWPIEWLEREQWMGHVEKKPFAPWADRDHPKADSDEDARWKWGLAENYVDGETVALAEDDPRLDGRAFLQQEDDPYAYVDGDDVRDPETGDFHPAFIEVLACLGATYTDVSQSGGGSHAVYRGELPDGVKQAAWHLDDEPFGANDDLPSIEIYAGKRVCVATGEHVPGTPTEIREWDEDALKTLLDENDQLPAEDVDRPSGKFDDFDADDYTPSTTSADETTDEIRDVFAALERLDAQRVADRTIAASWNDSASTSEGVRAFFPTFGQAENGTANIVDSEIWQDTGGGGYGGPVVMAAIDAGLVSESATPSDVRGKTWFDAVDHLRDLGFDIPELEDDATATEQVAVLPPSVRDLSTATSGWDWRHAAEQDTDGLTIDDARQRTVDAIADAYESYDQVLIEALPTMGKSYGSIKAAAKTDTKTSVLTGRGRKEQYEQFRGWCDEYGLEHYTLPAFTHDCDTANGEHGGDWQETVMDWYRRGATPKEIHKWAESVLDRPLPCQEHEGESCPYASKWDFDPDDYDVLIGHYAHAYKPKVTQGRVVVFDEFPGNAYETALGPRLQGAVSYWLAATDGVPFEDYTDLLENRSDEQRRADGLQWFLDNGIESDEMHVFDDSSAHATAPPAVFTMLASDDLGNGFEKADLEDVGTGVRNRRNDSISILRPPALEYASGVVALDGTPTKEMWELSLGERLEHRPILQPEERAEYVRDALNLNLVRTTEYLKPYNSADHVNTDGDAALLEAIRETHGERPSLITTSTAKHEYDAEGVLELIEETKHYGNVLGSNEFDDTRLGAVIGSNHYGDGYIKKWGAYAGETVDRNDEKGAALSYGAFGDRVLTHMREHDTLQAAMRFGRDGNGAVVYVHTDTLPEWVPLAGEGRVVTTWSDGMRCVLDAMADLGSATTAEIVEHPDVDIGRRQVFGHLESLRGRGVLSREQDSVDGRKMRWIDDGLHRVGEHGDVELEPVELDDLTDGEVAELARSTTYYTWEFRNPPEENARSGRSTGTSSQAPASGAADGGGLPDT